MLVIIIYLFTCSRQDKSFSAPSGMFQITIIIIPLSDFPSQSTYSQLAPFWLDLPFSTLFVLQFPIPIQAFQLCGKPICCSLKHH